MPLTFASLFTGGGGADQGARQAGLNHLWGVENNPKARRIAQLNGFDTRFSDVSRVDWETLQSPDWLHASPPCQRASAANTQQGESIEDVRLASAIAASIRQLQPCFFSLENVPAYESFEAFNKIVFTLKLEGYHVVYATLNAANYGVAQSRKRLFLIAHKNGKAYLPAVSHAKESNQLNLWGQEYQAWVGWEEAIAHLPAPPNKKLNTRQLMQLPIEYFGKMLCSGWNQCRAITMRFPHEPAPTVLASMKQPTLRPWIVQKDWHGRVHSSVLQLPHMAALQSFPANYRWGDDAVAAYGAIGNAVAPLLMQRIVEANLELTWKTKKEEFQYV